MKCSLCPRNCLCDRDNQTGYCGQTNAVRVARAALHFWEEPCISGEEGSGTVFFSGCSLRCIFCQNYEIASGDTGKEITVDRLSDIFIELQDKKANNINLVTGDHFVPQIAYAVGKAREKGLKIPVVYNTGGYIKTETLKLLKGIADIYLPDFKYFKSDTALNFSNASDYVETVKKAIEEMLSQTGNPVYDSRGIMKKGVIVRNMIIPGHTDESKEIIKYLYSEYGDRIVLSIMNQYTPMKRFERFPELNRKVSESEYDDVLNYAISIGVSEAYIQEGDTADESFIPKFDMEGV